MRSAHTLPAMAAASLALAFTSRQASATSPIPDNNWRQHDRPPRSEESKGPQRYAFELRFGPYRPEVDEGLAAKPYETVFGDKAQFYFGLELDWQALRIPYIGALGPGVGWGYTRTSRNARITGCTGSDSTCESGQTTALTIMPMHLSAVLRLDELMRRTRVPLVPYGKFGLGFATWSTGKADETSTYQGVLGRDTTWGLHTAVGGMLSLNWIDAESASNLYESMGIHHIYVFGEWMKANLDGLGSRPQMHVGTSTWTAGMVADF